MAETLAVEGLQRRMLRVDSALDMIRRVGHMAGPDNVIDVCWLIQKEVRAIAEGLEEIASREDDGQGRPSGKVEAPTQVAAPAEVMQLRPSRG